MMAIQRKRGDPTMTLVERKLPVAVREPAPAPAIDVAPIVDALRVVLYDQRVDHAGGVQQIVTALSKLQIPVGWTGNWNVSITNRDALGRISEVLFKPAKP